VIVYGSGCASSVLVSVSSNILLDLLRASWVLGSTVPEVQLRFAQKRRSGGSGVRFMTPPAF